MPAESGALCFCLGGHLFYWGNWRSEAVKQTVLLLRDRLGIAQPQGS